MIINKKFMNLLNDYNNETNTDCIFVVDCNVQGGVFECVDGNITRLASNYGELYKLLNEYRAFQRERKTAEEKKIKYGIIANHIRKMYINGIDRDLFFHYMNVLCWRKNR